MTEHFSTNPDNLNSTPLTATAPQESALLQIQNRMLQLATQLEQVQGQLDELRDETTSSSSQLAALTQHLTDVQPINLVNQQLAEVASQLDEQQTQIAGLLKTVVESATQTAQRTQIEQLLQRVAQRDQMEELLQVSAQGALRSQVEQLLQTVANQEQLDRLLQLMADRQQLESLDEAIKKLNRVQFKANTLSENKEQQIAASLATLSEIANRREQRQEQLNLRNLQQMNSMRSEGRAEMAAQLLPALDSLDLALEHGVALLSRQQEQVDALAANQRQFIKQFEQVQSNFQSELPQNVTKGFWQRFLQSPSSEPNALPTVEFPVPIPPTVVHTTFQGINDGVGAWLRGLELVRQRFVTLLASEEIAEIDALQQLFDPRLHVAVEADPNVDLPPDTVVRVVRKGYQQRGRVLRYAEVVISQKAAPD